MFNNLHYKAHEDIIIFLTNFHRGKYIFWVKYLYGSVLFSIKTLLTHMAPYL